MPTDVASFSPDMHIHNRASPFDCCSINTNEFSCFHPVRSIASSTPMAGLVLFLLLSLPLSATLGTTHRIRATAEGSSFSSLLVLGDSMFDTGNNNYIPTYFLANHLPYGRDLDGGNATGRFSNGLLVPDFLVSALGIKQRSPPFLDPTLSNADMLTGVNFASAGSGFDDVTTVLSGVIPISKQLEMFRAYLAKLELIAGKEEATKIINSALILISEGTNDFILNYYDLQTRKVQYTMEQYQEFILQKTRDAIEELYHLGGRRFAVVGLPPLGCVPVQITIDLENFKRACIAEENFDTFAYNAKLQELLFEMRPSLPEGRIAYIDVLLPLLDMVTWPQKYGFEVTNKGCCATGLVEAGLLCNSLSTSCPDASKYVYFDSIHPTEKAYRVIAKQILDEVVPQLY
uniref:GDSL esterase/lipase At2g30310 n=1 Tax=Anthurium amnicola TaxID=1678845 RepID=A0A1D1ZGK4_9ARAE